MNTQWMDDVLAGLATLAAMAAVYVLLGLVAS